MNAAIGNVSLPIHPALKKRMDSLTKKGNAFAEGIVQYSATVGTKEANDTIMHLLSSSGFETKGLFSQITDGGSMAMELVLAGVIGDVHGKEKTLLTIDPAYTNYESFSKRLRRSTISISRTLNESGSFVLPTDQEIEKTIQENNPNALLLIPYDNPTGQYYHQEELVRLARIAVKHDLWIISDEAYRELVYTDHEVTSIWGLTEKLVPGINGRRISIESASKVWNACGLRIGAVVTDNKDFHEKCVAEQTANLCANVIGQYVFSGLLNESKEDLTTWYKKQRSYYQKMIGSLVEEFKKEHKDIIVSKPEASLYSIIDVRNIVPENFDAASFVEYCATKGKVSINGNDWTLLVSPMSGFYSTKEMKEKARTQMRIAYVESEDKVKLIPTLFIKLLEEYTKY